MTRILFQQCCAQYLNIPYLWGGDDPMQGFDCSGLVQELLAMIGLDPIGDQTAQVLHDHFRGKSLEGVLDTGALVFFGQTRKHITHVGLMLDDQTMIEAGGGGSKTTDLTGAVKQNAYIRIRPYNKRNDLVAVLLPQGLPWTGGPLRTP
jgi:cell wall-associated NlpC family hydrolase